jgi:hypothetical protein
MREKGVFMTGQLGNAEPGGKPRRAGQFVPRRRHGKTGALAMPGKASECTGFLFAPDRAE